LKPVRSGKVDETVSVEAVSAVSLIQVIFKPLRGSQLGYAFIRGTSLTRGHSVFLRQHFFKGQGIADRCRGVQLEASPGDTDLVAMFEL
jgi:hypothetical protein